MLSTTLVQKTDHHSVHGADKSIKLRSAQNIYIKKIIPSVSTCHGRSYCLQKTTHAVSPGGVTRHVYVYCFKKKQRYFSVNPLTGSNSKPGFCFSVLHSKGKRGAEKPGCCGGMPESCLVQCHKYSTPDVLGSCYFLTYESSRFSCLFAFTFR